MKRDAGRKIVLWAAVLVLVAMAGQTIAAVRKGPYLIYPGNNTQMMVLWQLDGPASNELRWGEDTGYSEDSATPTAYGENQYKHTITGLTPGVKYYYEVQGVGSGSFLAAPPDDAVNVKSLAFGDTRTNPGTHDSVNEAMINAYTSDPAYQTFTMLSGDFVNNGDSESDWTNEFFARSLSNVVEMHANLPTNGCIGNHEGSGGLFDKYWPYPYETGGRWWSFDYGPVHVAVLVLTSEPSGTLGEAQKEWLEDDLAASDKEWKFLQFHAPVYSAGKHVNNTAEQAYIQNLCVTHGVDIVFSGHNHYYSRCDVSQGDGPHVQHITTGGGGAPLNPTDASYPYVVRVSSTNHFCKIDIHGRQLDFTAVKSEDNNVIDSFTLSHGPEEDITPPTPDPMEWLTLPHATGRTSISMTAVTPDPPDDLNNAEYYFKCIEDEAHDSGWQSNSTYEDTGLTPGTEYTYKVKVRDTSLNETGFSGEESATTDPPDTAPPTPDPMTWATPPESTGVYSVVMTATIASDPGGEDPEAVEYFFECTAGGGNDSDWQDSNVYENRELSENTLYTYRVRARDKSPNQNETEWSDELSARTDIDFPDPGDLNRDRVVDLLDLGLFGLQWGRSGCGVEDFWCDFADIDRSTGIDTTDLSTFADHWLEGFTIDIGFDTFDSYPDGTRVADLPDWFAGHSSSEIQSIGIGGSQGFTSDSTVLTWSAGDGSINGFNWSDMETGDAVVLSMDFEFNDGFEDDAVGWIIGHDSTDRRDYFRVRLWRIGLLGDRYGIEGHWHKAESESGFADVTIAEISDTLTTGSWYRLRAEFTRLTATSVSIDAEVWLLDAAGAEMRKIAIGSIPDTSTLGAKAPHTKFFENDVWPAFRNDDNNDGACDNAYYGFMPTH